MSVEDLNSSKNGMKDDNAGCSLANEPIPTPNVNWLSIQSIWMYRGFNEREAREYGKTCA